MTKNDFELFVPTSVGKAMRFGTSSLLLVILSLITLAFFSVTDIREIKYQKREQTLNQEHLKNEQAFVTFSQWLKEKERDLNRYLWVTGDYQNNSAPVIKMEAGADSYETVRQTLERLENRIRIASDFQLRDEEYFWNVPSIAPVALEEEFILATAPMASRGSKGLAGVSSFQGMRIHPLNQKEEMHYGLDIFCPLGTKVRASGNGVVSFVGKFNPDQDNIRHSFGNFIVIRHGDTGIETTYAHMDTLKVSKGELVKRGEILGTTGNSGSSTGPHLHYEINRNGIRVNPLNYINDVPLVEAGKKIFYVKNDKKGKAHSKKRGRA